ncbi:MAG: hypothetical protein AB2A00_24910 [Myxococcota bacterium]
MRKQLGVVVFLGVLTGESTAAHAAPDEWTVFPYVGGAAGSGYTDGLRQLCPQGAADPSTCPVSALFSNPSGIVVTQDAVAPWGGVPGQGMVYVSERATHVIRRINLETGEVTTVAGLYRSAGYADGVGANARFNTPTAMVLAPGETSLYVVDRYNSVIRHIDLTTGEVSTLIGIPGVTAIVDGPQGVGALHTPEGLAYHLPRNELWVTDAHSGLVRAISLDSFPPSITTLAGSNDGFADGCGAAAMFRGPQDITISPEGVAFVADTLNYRVRWVVENGAEFCVGTVVYSSNVSAMGMGYDEDTNGGYALIGNSNRHNILFFPGTAVPQVVNFLAGNGAQGWADGTDDTAYFSFPRSIDSERGTHYVADSNTFSVRMVDYSGNVETVAGGRSYRQRYSLTPDGGPLPDHQMPTPLDEPRGMAFGPQGQLYVADKRQHNIKQLVTLDCGQGPALQVKAIAGQVYIPGSAVDRAFNGPMDVAVDGLGYLYVADFLNNQIQRVTPPPPDQCQPVAPQQVVWAGLPGRVRGLALSQDGQYLFATAGYGVYRVSVVDQDTNGVPDDPTVLLWAGGNPGWSDGLGSNATFNSPEGIVRDPNSNDLYVADTYNYAIRKIVPDQEIDGTPVGRVTTVAGNAFENFWRDGPAGSARFENVYDVAVDATGNVYVTEDFRIRRIGTDGNVATVIGGQGSGVSTGTGPDGAVNAAAGILWQPTTGNLFISDTQGRSIRLARPAIPDRPTVNYIRAPVGMPVQLGTAPQTATTWTWDYLRHPNASVAPLLTTASAPSFTPDVADLFIFRVTMSNNLGVTRSTVTVDVCATAGPGCPACGVDEVCPACSYCCIAGDPSCTVGACPTTLPGGSACTRDTMCASGNCDETIGQCTSDISACNTCSTPCGDDSACPATDYCRDGCCRPRDSCGDICDRNRMCDIDVCANGVCGCCTNDNQCLCGCDEVTGACNVCDAGAGTTDGGTPGDAGNADGNRADAGNSLDAGIDRDAGNRVDAGNRTDAGATSCVIDSDCPWDRYCLNGTCVVREDCASACDRDRMCLSDSCVDNSCFCCTNDNQCASLDCDETTGRCTPPDGGGPECITDSNCPSDEYCEGGACVPRKDCGLSCDRARMCLSNSCTGNVCSNCATCINDAMCPTGNYCCQAGDPNCQTGACVLACADNAQCCDRDAMCLSGICEENTRTCLPQADAGPTTQCTVDSDCPSDAYCQGTTCVLTETCGVLCDRNSMCLSNSCVAGVCSDCVACTQDPQCPARMYCCLTGEDGCTPGTCTADCVDNNVCCDRDNMCLSGICEETTRTCQPQADAGVPTQCNVDSDCPSEMYCQDGACVPREACDVLCDRNRMCISDTCEGGLCVAGANGCNPGSSSSSGGAGTNCDAGVDAGAGLDGGDNARRRDGGPARRGNIAQEAGHTLARACGCSTAEGGASPEMLVSAGALVVLALTRRRRIP